MPNGIDLIRADHQAVKELFAEFDSTHEANTIGLIIAALKSHDEAEQAALYPFAGLVLGDKRLIERAEKAHSAVKKQFDLIATLEGAGLVQAVVQLRKLVTQHVADEEKNLLPALEDKATAEQLDELGARVLQAKQRGG